MGDTDRDVTLSDVNALTYLGQAIMESMRIHGTFPVILRRATKDTKLCKCRLHTLNWYQLTVFICVTQAITIVYTELSFLCLVLTHIKPDAVTSLLKNEGN